MKKRPAATRRIAALSILLSVTLSASAQTAYVPEWIKEEHYVYQTLRVSPHDDLFSDITVASTEELPLATTLFDSSAVTRADANTALSYANGVFTLTLAPVVSSVDATIDEYGYALSDGGVSGSFIANMSELHVNYSIDGSMYANNPTNALTYASIGGKFYVRDATVGSNWQTEVEWINLYDDNEDGSGTFAYSLQSSGTSTIPLTIGQEYKFGFYIYADTLSTGTSDAGVLSTITLDFAIPPVPEPSQPAMTALGLLCLAGVLRMKSKREA